MDEIICYANGTCDMIFSNPMWDLLPAIIGVLLIITLAAIIYRYFPIVYWGEKKKK